MKYLFMLWISIPVVSMATVTYTTFSNKVTYTSDIKPIFQKYCSSCHFGSLSYEASYKNRNKIYDKFVRSRQMPPKYVAERPNEAEVQLVKKWIESGAEK